MVERIWTRCIPISTVELTVDRSRGVDKTQIRNFADSQRARCGQLVRRQPHDVLTWTPVSLMDISDLVGGWRLPRLLENLASTKGAMTTGGQASGVCLTPITSGACTTARTSTTSWVLSEPSRLGRPSEVANCQAIHGFSGRQVLHHRLASFLWTAGGWFDYLNMRTNGYRLSTWRWANGEIESWTDLTRSRPDVRQLA